MQIVSDFYGKFFREDAIRGEGTVGGEDTTSSARCKVRFVLWTRAHVSGAVIVKPPPPARSKGGVERRNEYRSTHRFDTTFIM